MKLSKSILAFFVLSVISVIKADLAAGESLINEIEKGEAAAVEGVKEIYEKMTLDNGETEYRKLQADTTKKDATEAAVKNANDQTCTTNCFKKFWKDKQDCVPATNKTIETYQEFCAKNYYNTFGTADKNLAVNFIPHIFTKDGLIDKALETKCPDPPTKVSGADTACQNLVRYTVSPKYIDPQTSDGLVKIEDAWKKFKTESGSDELHDCTVVGDGILQCIYDSQVGYKDCAEKCNPKPKHETFIQLTKKEFCPKF